MHKHIEVAFNDLFKETIETINEGCVIWVLLGAGIAAIIAGGFIL